MSLSLFVIGSTRGTGRHVLQQALDAGHRVTALVRDGSTPPDAHPQLTIVRGDATDAERLAELLPGHDAVISTIGAPPSSTSSIRTRSAEALVEAMRRAGVARLLSLSSHGVAESRTHLPFFFRTLILPFYLEGVFADHAGQEGVIRASGLDWTLARPPSLKDADAAGPEALFAGVDADGQAPIRMAISRQDVASFLLSSAVDGSFRQAAPVVAVRR